MIIEIAQHEPPLEELPNRIIPTDAARKVRPAVEKNFAHELWLTHVEIDESEVAMGEVGTEPLSSLLQEAMHVAELFDGVANLVRPTLAWKTVDIAQGQSRQLDRVRQRSGAKVVHRRGLNWGGSGFPETDPTRSPRPVPSEAATAPS